MKVFTSVKLKKWDRIVEKFIVSKIWKKKFSNIPVDSIIGFFFNISSSNRKIFGFSHIDFILYIVLIKIENLSITSFPSTLFQLQKESIIVRLFGLLYQKVLKKFLIFNLENFKWKNDLRLNENFRFLFEKKVNYLNKRIGFIFNYTKKNYLIFNIFKQEEKEKCYEFPNCFTPKIKIQGNLSYLTFKLF